MTDMEPQAPNLTTLILELYQRLTGNVPAVDLGDAIRQRRWDCDLEDDAMVPTWLLEMFSSVLRGEDTGVVRFERIGSDVSSFLLDVATLIPGWKHDDHGESIEIDLAPLGVYIHLSRESRSDSGAHCSSYHVTRTPAAAG